MSVFGVDLGTSTCVVAGTTNLDDIFSPDIVLNKLSSRSTPSVVAFSNRLRLPGESGVGQISINGENAIADITRILGLSFSEYQEKKDSGFSNGEFGHHRYSTSKGENDALLVDVSYAHAESDTHQFRVEQLLAILLKNLKEDVIRQFNLPEDQCRKCVFAVPSCYSSAQLKALQSAAKIAGLDVLHVISTTAALATSYANKHFNKQVLLRYRALTRGETPEEAEGESMHVCLVDVGHGYSSVSVIKYPGDGTWELVASEWSDCISGGALERRLFNALHAEKFTQIPKAQPGKRGAVRLLSEVRKMKHILSANPQTTFVLECFDDDKDVKCTMSKEQFARICSEEITQFTDMIKRCLDRAQAAGVPSSNIASFEVVGHGVIPSFLQDCIAAVTGSKPSKTLDSGSSVAIGAASAALLTLNGSSVPSGLSNTDADVAWGMSDAEVEAAVLTEGKMAEQDGEIERTAQKRNDLESRLCGLRDACATHDALRNQPAGDKLGAKLRDVSDWLESEEGEEATLAQYEEKLKEVEHTVITDCEDYVAALKKAEEEEKKRSEEEAIRLSRERAQMEAEDHDNRKLKKADRMKIVERNKGEATELFQGGNFEHAAARYLKALGHCEKFFDLSPEDEVEVNKMRVTLYLNLAMCYLKLKAWKKAGSNCSEALKLDPENPKALYRRALSSEARNELADALEDLKKATDVAPTDPGIKTLLTRVQTKVKKEDAKQKKAFSKMFG